MSTSADKDSHTYDSLFYEYQREGSARSALSLLPAVIEALGVGSVLDVGCGAGAWLSAYRQLDIVDCTGVDGDYVDRSLLVIDQDAFHPRDITQPFDFQRKFDIVQCLEVAEHVPPQTSQALVDNLTRHGKMVLFSAAVPGQGGKGHINEQPYEYWRDLFVERGYRLFDFVRPLAAGNEAIEPWYRYNILFFAHDSVVPSLPAQIASTRIRDGAPVPDYSPLAYRLRKMLLRSLPDSAVSMLAVMKHRYFVHSQLRR
jgi:SAM-dependent methyltransferase